MGLCPASWYFISPSSQDIFIPTTNRSRGSARLCVHNQDNGTVWIAKIKTHEPIFCYFSGDFLGYFDQYANNEKTTTISFLFILYIPFDSHLRLWHRLSCRLFDELNCFLRPGKNLFNKAMTPAQGPSLVRSAAAKAYILTITDLIQLRLLNTSLYFLNIWGIPCSHNHYTGSDGQGSHPGRFLSITFVCHSSGPLLHIVTPTCSPTQRIMNELAKYYICFSNNKKHRDL